MESAMLTDTLTVMTTGPDALRQRLDALDLRRREARPRITIDRLLKAAGYEGVQTWYDVLAGKRPVETVERFEQALDYLAQHPDDVAEEPTHVVAPAPSELIEFEVTGDFGVRVVVRGPIGDSEAVEQAARRIIRDIRRSQEPNQGDK